MPGTSRGTCDRVEEHQSDGEDIRFRVGRTAKFPPYASLLPRIPTDTDLLGQVVLNLLFHVTSSPCPPRFSSLKLHGSRGSCGVSICHRS